MKSLTQGVTLEVSVTGKDLGEKLKKVVHIAEAMATTGKMIGSQFYSESKIYK